MAMLFLCDTLTTIVGVFVYFINLLFYFFTNCRMKRFEWPVRIFLTNWASYETNMDAEGILNLWKKLRDHSFINVGDKYFNKINISYVVFPDDVMLQDLTEHLANKDYSDVDFLDEWTFVDEEDLSPNENE